MRHIGIIMDGNRRWAKQRGLSPIDGHKQGYRTLKELLRTVKELNIEFLSVYTFSTENWNRKKSEVDGIMKLIRWVLKNESKELIEEELKVIFVGSWDGISEVLKRATVELEKKTAHFTKGTLAICFNYGGHQEIIDAVSVVNEKGEKVTQESIEKHLYRPELPPIDLVIRTSGEQRLSNFMLWRAAYSELYFTDTLWPDFSGAELSNIVNEYQHRDRRFGK